jgi:hypothetical protein
MSTDKKAIVISLDFDNCLWFVLFFSDRGVTKNLIVSVQKNKSGLQYFSPRVAVCCARSQFQLTTEYVSRVAS